MLWHSSLDTHKPELFLNQLSTITMRLKGLSTTGKNLFFREKWVGDEAADHKMYRLTPNFVNWTTLHVYVKQCFQKWCNRSWKDLPQIYLKAFTKLLGSAQFSIHTTFLDFSDAYPPQTPFAVHVHTLYSSIPQDITNWFNFVSIFLISN